MFALATVVAFVAMALWSLATPLYAAPDEPVQVIKAAAVVRGQLVGDTTGAPGPAFAKVAVPAFFAKASNRGSPGCFHEHPSVPASCAPPLVTARGTLDSWIYVARYPPLYYAVVGLPTLLGQGAWVVYLMRLVSALCSALLVGLAVFAATTYASNRLVLVGGLVACTPMVVFLGGVVNPNGLEVAAALCVWTSGAVLVSEHLEDPPPGLVAVLAGSACLLELTRSLSPFWLALTGLVLAFVAGRARLSRLVARPSVRLGLLAVVACGALALSWILAEQATNVASTGAVGAVPETTILETALARTDAYLKDMVGVFGWLDTPSPLLTDVVWYGLVGLVVVLAAAVGRRRHVVALAGLAVLVIALPVVIPATKVHEVGYVWQGRDTLPLAVGLPVLSAAVLGQSALAHHARRLAGVVAVSAGVAQAAAFFEALRRYAIGTAGPDFGFLVHPSWRPPLGFAPLLVGEAAVLFAGGLLVVLATSPRGRHAARPRRVPLAGAPGAGSSP